MTAGSMSRGEIACALVWKLARGHGWSVEVSVGDLARDAPVTDEREARDVARNDLPQQAWIGYHKGRDEIWLQGPPSDDVCYYLRDECGYAEIQIEATFDSYFDGF